TTTQDIGASLFGLFQPLFCADSGILCNQWADTNAGVTRITSRQACGGFSKALSHFVGDAAFYIQTLYRSADLSGFAECGVGDLGDCNIQVGIGAYDSAGDTAQFHLCTAQTCG